MTTFSEKGVFLRECQGSVSQVPGQTRLNGVPEEALRMRFHRPQGAISRRELFKALLPQYQVIPYIQPEICAGAERCRLCRESCPFDAIVLEGDHVSIDKLSCQGCGACVTVCPRQAVSYPTFSLEELARGMEGLLLSEGAMLEPRIVAVICQSCLPSFAKTGANLLRYAPNVLLLEVPCLAMVSPWLMLRAFDLGAEGLAIISNQEMCQLGLGCDQWQDNVRFTQELLELWGMGRERIGAFDASGLEQELFQFIQQVAGMPSTGLRAYQPTAIPDRGLLLPSLIASLTQKLAPSSGGAVSAGNVPFGKLELDRSQCTACGLCALECPTEALRFLTSGDTLRLLFEPQSCVGCGQCVKICPENCLHLENVLDLHRLNGPAETLLEAEIARCQECGAPIAPRAMIDRLRTRIAAEGELTSQLDICPACRTKAVSGTATSMMRA